MVLGRRAMVRRRRAYMKLGMRAEAQREMDLFKKMSQYNKEKEHIGKILLYMPGDAAAHWKLGRIHEKYGQYERAIAAYRKALTLRPGFGEARQGLKEALQRAQSL